MIKNFDDFKRSKQTSILSENVQAAKAYMINRAIQDKGKRSPDIRLTPEEEKEALEDTFYVSGYFSKEDTLKKYLDEKKKKYKGTEKKDKLDPMEERIALSNPQFKRIKEMCMDTPGYTYLFTKIFFEDFEEQELDEAQRFQSLSELKDKIISLKDSITSLPMKVDDYASKNAIEEERRLSQQERRTYRGPYERLVDDLSKLEEEKYFKSGFFDNLLRWQKDWFKNMTPAQKEKIEGISNTFQEISNNPQLGKDYTRRNFFNKVKDYKSLNDLIKASIEFIRQTNNMGAVKTLKLVEKINKIYGDVNGVDVVWSNENILVLEIKSYAAIRMLGPSMSHCIFREEYHYRNYIGDFNKQYYIYDFSLEPSDPKSIIGITIDEKGGIKACHVKNNDLFKNEIESYCKRKGIPLEVFAPMSPKEVEEKKRRIAANKEIAKPRISIDDVKRYFEIGADPNASNGAPLSNAIKEEDIERAKYLISIGANPNINQSIRFAKDLEMIKVLVDGGSELTSDVFQGIMNDKDAIEYVLKAGIDPNFDNGYPIRRASKDNNLDTMVLLVKYGAKISERGYMVMRTASEHGRTDILSFFIKRAKETNDPIVSDKALRKKVIENIIYYTNSSSRIDKETKKETVKLLTDFLNS